MLVIVLQRSFLFGSAVDREQEKSQSEWDLGFSLTRAILTKLWLTEQHSRGKKSTKKDFRAFSLPILRMGRLDLSFIPFYC